MTRNEAIATIEETIRAATLRATKPLKPERAAAVRAESFAAFDASLGRFPTAAILEKFVKYRTYAKPPVEPQASADPPAQAKRWHAGQAQSSLFDEMSPSGENALRNLEGD